MSDENRRIILFLLRKHEMNPTDLLRNFKFSAPALSLHLQILKRSHLIKERRDGTSRIYSINRKSILNMQKVIDDMLDTGLNNLKNSTEKKEFEF